MYKVFNEFSRPNIPKTIRFPEKMSLELGRASPNTISPSTRSSCNVAAMH